MSENKAKIYEKFIELLQFEGWNQQTLEKACVEAGFDATYCNIVYPGKITEFTNDFASICNKEALAKAQLIQGFDKLRITQKVEEIIYQRIRTYHFKLGNLEGLKKFVGYAITPSNLPNSMHNIYDFASDVWYALGDKSTDFSYYTKRVSLSGIYSKCMLYSMSDKSENLQQTRKFIQKSIDGLMKINKLKSRLKDLKSFLVKTNS